MGYRETASFKAVSALEWSYLKEARTLRTGAWEIRRKDRMVNTGVSLDTSDEVVIKGVTPGD